MYSRGLKKCRWHYLPCKLYAPDEEVLLLLIRHLIHTLPQRKQNHTSVSNLLLKRNSHRTQGRLPLNLLRRYNNLNSLGRKEKILISRYYILDFRIMALLLNDHSNHNPKYIPHIKLYCQILQLGYMCDHDIQNIFELYQVLIRYEKNHLTVCRKRNQLEESLFG